MIVKAIREGLGRVFVLGNFLTRPKPMQRSEAAQTEVDTQTQYLSLYQFYACPFCIKARRAIHRLNLNIETRDAQAQGEHRTALEQNGGRVKVPCLRISQADDKNGEDQWMYESNDIIAYLDERFGHTA